MDMQLLTQLAVLVGAATAFTTELLKFDFIPEWLARDHPRAVSAVISIGGVVSIMYFNQSFDFSSIPNILYTCVLALVTSGAVYKILIKRSASTEPK